VTSAIISTQIIRQGPETGRLSALGSINRAGRQLCRTTANDEAIARHAKCGGSLCRLTSHEQRATNRKVVARLGVGERKKKGKKKKKRKKKE
jgi:hypothetical protein